MIVRAFQGVGLALSLGAVAWFLLWPPWSGSGEKRTESLQHLASPGAAAELRPPHSHPQQTKEIQRVFRDAEQSVDGLISSGNRFRLFGRVAEWLSFSITALITLLAGFWRASPRGGASSKEVTASTAALQKETAADVGDRNTSVSSEQRPKRDETADRVKRRVSILGGLAAAASLMLAGGAKLSQEALQVHASANRLEEIVGGAKEDVRGASERVVQAVLRDLKLAVLRSR